MAWFVDKLCGDVADTPSDAENTDTDELPQAAGASGSDSQAEQSAAATDPGADTLMGIEHFYAASDNVGPEIDAQLAKILSGFVKTRLPDDKLKEKLTACLAPKYRQESTRRFGRNSRPKPNHVMSNHSAPKLHSWGRSRKSRLRQTPSCDPRDRGSPFRSGDGDCIDQPGRCIGVARQRKPRHEPVSTRRPARRYKQRL